jgi:hypothetical protein
VIGVSVVVATGDIALSLERAGEDPWSSCILE